jgi:predicted N-acetyltransferase YhbS
MGKVSGGSTGTERLAAPALLAGHHDLDGFDSGVATLDEWLKRRARRNEAEGASRTFVTCAGRRVVGYYSLAAGSILHVQATGRVSRNMPEPVPVLLLGRLAVDRAWHGKGIGADLLQDAVLRAIGAAETIGIRAILVHAISDGAKAFYLKHGFRPSPIEPLTLMITIQEAKRMLSATPGT